MEINIKNKSGYYIKRSYKKIIHDAIIVSCDEENINNNNNRSYEVNIIVSNNKQMVGFNKKFRGINKPTDVISLPMFDFNNIEKYFLQQRLLLLGDIIISIEKVTEQAHVANKSIEHEIALLVVHGFLHLVGYDHNTDTEEKIMNHKQDAILNKMYLLNSKHN
jgi:probable rRNA maturation factor